MSASGQLPLEDLVEESERVLYAVRAKDIPVRLAGGLAIRRRNPSAASPPLARTYADLDLAVSSQTGRRAVDDFMTYLGYVGDISFNSLHGSERLFYEDRIHRRHVDVFVDSLRMCHTIEFRNRLLLLSDTLPVTDLLLTKLQVVQLNEKDVLDILAVLHDQPILPGANDHLDSDYLEKVWGSDWPLWRTCQLTLKKVREAASGLLSQEGTQRVSTTMDALNEILRGSKKSMRWRMRSRLGDRIRWYELPEEIAG